ncbi:hypothetical protein GGS26DRAFT_594769 [Hypomontagnella submonticulosa]|nr:hypothetical protein GGS26DRAFT_594769 [Hypomontagnella submonticulosa]
MVRPIPLEVVYLTMSCLLPADKNTFIPPDHEATQLLLSFSRTSIGTRKEAIRLMKQHCMFIESDDRLTRFLRCLRASRQSNTSLPSIFTEIDQLCIIPRDRLERFDRDNVGELFGRLMFTLRRLVMNLEVTGVPREFNGFCVLEELVCSEADFKTATVLKDDDGRVWKSHPWRYLKRLAIAGIMPLMLEDFLWLFKDSHHSRHLERVVLLDIINYYSRRHEGGGHVRAVSEKPEALKACNDHRRDFSMGPLTVVLAQTDYHWSKRWPLWNYENTGPDDIKFVECDYTQQWPYQVVRDRKYKRFSNQFWSETAVDGRIWAMGEGCEFTSER